MSTAKHQAQRITVLGCGMLGSAVAARFEQENLAVRSFDLPNWDITREEDLAAAVDGADVVINCAAYTNVDGAESDVDTAFAVNAAAPQRLGALCRDAGVYAVHIGTDFVFSGRQDGPYAETDAVAPLSVYGRSKAAGDAGFLAVGAGAVLRVQWTYGANGNNFVTKIVSLAADRDMLQVVNDQIGSPTWTRDMAEAVRTMVAGESTGLYHFAAAGYTSRYDMACMILEKLGLDCRVEPCGSDTFPAPAERPLNSRFNCDKFDRDIGSPRPFWRDALLQYLETLA